LQLTPFNNPASTRNENKEYDNFTVKKINRPVAFAARFPARAARACVLCAFANGSSRKPTTKNHYFRRTDHR